MKKLLRGSVNSISTQNNGLDVSSSSIADSLILLSIKEGFGLKKSFNHHTEAEYPGPTKATRHSKVWPLFFF